MARPRWRSSCLEAPGRCRTRAGNAREVRRSRSVALADFELSVELATDARMLEEILGEAAEFWQERHVPFWVFVGV